MVKITYFLKTHLDILIYFINTVKKQIKIKNVYIQVDIRLKIYRKLNSIQPRKRNLYSIEDCVFYSINQTKESNLKSEASTNKKT